MNKKIADKFFTNQASPEEVQRILEWFETHAGRKYLQKRLDVDSDLMGRQELKELVSELDSEKLYSAIQGEIRKKRNIFSLQRVDWVGNTAKAAAAILVIVSASLFSITHENYLANQANEQQPIVFQTAEEENSNITLTDGTQIRLNSHSEIIVAPNYLKGTREVTLIGEAYFDVAHNPNQPFLINANQSSIEVLGTAFNVRSVAGQQNVQVAVVEGRVSFRGAENGHGQEQLSVNLSKNQYGYLDLKNRSMSVDDLAVDNYLAWKSGWLNFEELTMQQVCTQLNRIYSLECSFVDERIMSLQLTAKFSNESLEKTLEVIAMSLELKYERHNNLVKWSEDGSAHLKEVK